MQQPAVTVLMPVYNGEAYLREAIDSILNQSFKNFEFLIINDGSTDSTGEIIKSYTDPRIRYVVNEKNLRLIATLNKGFDLASGRYIARMDADDISLPTRLQQQFDLMEAQPEVGLCGTWYESFDGNKILGGAHYGPDHETICFKHLFQIHLSHGTGMFRASVLKEHNLYFDPGYAHAEDYELWSRISTVTKLANIQQVLYRVRHHENEVSKKYAGEQRDNSYRVKAGLFNRMGIEVTVEDMDVFRALAYHDYRGDDNFQHKAKSLLERMLKAHNYDVFFSKDFFEKQLAGYWFNLKYNSTAFNGLKAYTSYNASPLATINPPGLATRLRFITKGLLKK